VEIDEVYKLAQMSKNDILLQVRRKKVSITVSLLQECLSSSDEKVRYIAIDLALSSEEKTLYILEVLIKHYLNEESVNNRKKIVKKVSAFPYSDKTIDFLTTVVSSEEMRFIRAEAIKSLSRLGFTDWSSLMAEEQEELIRDCSFRTLREKRLESQVTVHQHKSLQGDCVVINNNNLGETTLYEILYFLNLDQSRITSHGKNTLSISNQCLESLAKAISTTHSVYLELARFSGSKSIYNESRLTLIIEKAKLFFSRNSFVRRYKLVMTDFVHDTKYKKIFKHLVNEINSNNDVLDSLTKFDVILMLIKSEGHVFFCASDEHSHKIKEKQQFEKIPASVKSEVAASLAILGHMEMSKRRNVSIIDPCCGAGTILGALSRIFPESSLSGVETSSQTLKIAQKNLVNLTQTQRLTLYHSDFRLILPTKKLAYDLLICNPPFGIRVKTRESNISLYKGLMENSINAVKSGGIIVFYVADMRSLNLESYLNSIQILRVIRLKRRGGIQISICVLRKIGDQPAR
jgi:23S rRNA G2445 N2-methylase RlmL